MPKPATGAVAFKTQPAVVHIEEDLYSVSWCYQLLIENHTDQALKIVEAKTLLYRGKRLVLEETLGAAEIARHAKPVDVKRLWFRPDDYAKPHRPVIPASGAVRWSDNYFYRPRGCEATAVVHRFVFETPGGKCVDAECRVPLKRNRQATRLRLPFDGWWQMLAGHEQHEHHMRGGGGMGQDFVGIAAGGAPCRGSGKRLSDWTCYKREVKAPAAGVVTRVCDDNPDSPPGRPLHNMHNCVIIDHGSDESTFLAHLVPGSIVVAVGDRVEAGQTLGLCGNSGYSLVPHVHLGLSRKSVGVPIVLSGYKIMRAIEDAADEFSLVQTVDRGVVRHGDIVCHAG